MVAVAGVVILSCEEHPEHAGVARRSIVLAILAGARLRGVLHRHRRGFPGSPRLGDLRRSSRRGERRRAALLISRPRFDGVVAAVPVLAAIGMFDIVANALFAVASTKGILPVVAVGGSTYPAFTIALAHLVLGERLATIQWGGFALALVGVGLITGGS